MIIDRYYYHQLNKREQAIYKAFYDGVKDFKDVIPVPVRGIITEETFNKVFHAITRDNPLIYYLNQTACYMARDAFGHNAICPKYFLEKKKVKEYNRKIESVVNKLAGELNLTECSDYDKVLRVHDWMCQNVTYDEKGDDKNDPVRVISCHNIIGVFAHHKAQCEGIAKAVKVLLNAVDVKCIVATGNADGNGQNGPHAWNIVSIENKAYQLDVTWDIGAVGNNKDRDAYDYFNLTDEMMYKDHTADSKLPVCDSTEMNYFRKNKLVFKSRTMLLAYIDLSLRKGKKDFYLQLDGRLKLEDVVKDISDMAAKILSSRGSRGIRIQHSLNDKIRTCWVRVN